MDCQTKDWERRHSRECKKALAPPVPVLPAPKLPKRRTASQSITTPPASSSVLGPADLKCLAKNMNLNENWLAKCLQDESSLMNLKASDLRTILCFLRDNCNRKNIRVSGNLRASFFTTLINYFIRKQIRFSSLCIQRATHECGRTTIPCAVLRTAA